MKTSRFRTTAWITQLLLVLLASLLLPISAMASTYYASITVPNTSATAYTMLPVAFTSNNSWMAANGFMLPTGLDTRVQTAAGVALPHMVRDTATMFASPIPATSTTNLQYTMGNAPLSSFYVIPGYNGYITTADNATIESGAAFSKTIVAYVDTSASQIGKEIYSKGGAEWMDVPSASNLRENIGGGGAADNVTQDAQDSTVHLYAGSTTRAGERIDSFARGNHISQASWLLKRNNSPTGTGYAKVYKQSDNSLIGTLGTINVATIDAVTPTLYTFNTTAVLMPATENIYIVFEYDGGNAGDYIIAYYKTADPYVGGVFSSYDGSWHDNAAVDATFRMSWTQLVSVTAAATSGLRTLTPSLAGGTLSLQVDGGIPTTTASGGAVPDSSTNWTWGSTAVPYFTSIKCTIGATEHIWYQLTSYVVGTALPNRDDGGGCPGVFTWGANPAGVTATVGSLIVVGTGTTPTVSTESVKDVAGDTNTSEWYHPDETALAANPLHPVVEAFASLTTFTEIQIWRVGMTLVIMIITAGAFIALPNHTFFSGIACMGGFGWAVATSIYPWATLIPAALYLLATILWERTPYV